MLKNLKNPQNFNVFTIFAGFPGVARVAGVAVKYASDHECCPSKGTQSEETGESDFPPSYGAEILTLATRTMEEATVKISAL